MLPTFRPFSADLYTKCVLTAIALLLGALLIRPAIAPAPVRAQSDSPRFYIEPGKVIVDLQTGDIWGFLTNNQDLPYPTDFISNKPPVSSAIYLGRFDFDGMKRPK